MTLVVVGWMIGWVLLWRLPALSLPRRDRSSIRPPVTVVVPARNEADRIPLLLASLATQCAPADQVVVVDDDSSDDTAALAAAFDGVEVISSPPLPEGWAGKPWACTAGVAVARNELLVFLDADVELAPDALDALVTSWREHGGLLSVQPHHHIDKPIESLSLPFNVVSMMGLGVGSLIPPRRQWGAAGPCLITSRTDYDQIGGHATVAGEVAEDLALAEQYGKAGLAVNCFGGGNVVRYRMYRNLRGMVEGWSKNLVTGARRTPIFRSVAVGLWLTALLTMALHLVDGFEADNVWLWAGTYLAGAIQFTVLGRRVGHFGPVGLLWPVLLVFFMAVFAVSAVRTLVFRQVRWSGRQIAVASFSVGDGRAPGRSGHG